MGNHGSHEIEDETDSRRDSDRRPPDSNYEPHCTGKLACGQQRKVLQWEADSFVNHFNLMRMTLDLADSGKQYHEPEYESSHEVRNMHRDDRYFSLLNLRKYSATASA